MSLPYAKLFSSVSRAVIYLEQRELPPGVIFEFPSLCRIASISVTDAAGSVKPAATWDS